MGSKSDYMEDKILNLMRGTSFTAPSAVYIGLLTVAAGENSAGTEVSGNAYARQAVTFGAPSSGQIANSVAVNFPIPTPSGWGTIVGWAVFDASTGGNVLIYGDQSPNKVINAGDTVTYAIGAITYSES